MCQRNDFSISNLKGEALKCTHITTNSQYKRPCVIYMHGNAGNKLEGLEYAPLLLPMGFDLFTFDFSGCGNSEG
jgi:hypothetical protein